MLTHPTQYYAPWFRHLHAHRPEIALHALYATTPSSEQQSVGFGGAFQWDVPVLEGYPHTVVRPPRPTDSVHSSTFWGLDVPEIGAALRTLRPDVAVVFGWYSISLLRALAACKRLGIPTLYRGDTNLASAPSGWRRRLWSLKNRWLITKAFDGLLSVGTRCREFLRAMGARAERIFDAPHCVDNAYFAASAARLQNPKDRAAIRREWGFGVDDFVVLFVGKLEPKKRPLDAVDAVAKLAGDAALVVAGSGPSEAAVRERIASANVKAHLAGFVNQSRIGRCYAAADVLVLPSDGQETWGLAVNEALATGLPCIVSDRVGCAPDLVASGATGEVFPVGDVDRLADALRALRERQRAGHDFAPACRATAARYSFDAAGEGLVRAVQAVARKKAARSETTVVAAGAMAFVGGLERQSFKVLETLRRRGQPVHVVGNDWAGEDRPHEPHPIKRLADDIGASWSVGHDRSPLAAARTPWGFVNQLWEFAKCSRELVRQCQRRRANYVFLPDFDYPLRNVFALPWLRRCGVKTVLRVGVAPDRRPFWEFVWGRVFPGLIDEFVANSAFGAKRLRECGVPRGRIRCIRNAVAKRNETSERDREIAALIDRERTVLYVGQIAPFKGVHLLLDAAAELWRRGLRFQVVVVGRFPDWPDELVAYFRELRARAEALRPGVVEFVGEANDALFLMERAFVLAAPIVQEETFGNVVLEARVSGLPAVATPRGGLPELVEHRKTGYLCRDASTQAVAEGLAWYLEEPARRESASRACRASTERPDWPYQPEKFAAAWRRVFAPRTD